MIPEFNEFGELPAGIHTARLQEIVKKLGWTKRRKILLEGLRRGLKALKLAGCKTVYIDGSFATIKDEPGDFDVCWETTGVIVKKLDPVFLDFSNRRYAQKQKYAGEFFPADFEATPDGLRYLEFFQTNKSGDAKGIIQIKLQG